MKTAEDGASGRASAVSIIEQFHLIRERPEHIRLRPRFGIRGSDRFFRWHPWRRFRPAPFLPWCSGRPWQAPQVSFFSFYAPEADARAAYRTIP